VPRAQFAESVAWSSSVNRVATVIGPALGGLIYLLGAQAAFAACLLQSLLVSAAMIAIRTRVAPAVEKGSTAFSRAVAGLRYVRRQPVVFGAISLDLFAVLLGGATALLPMFAKDLLHVGPWGLGLLRGAPAVGALAMSIALTRWPITRRAGRTMLWAVAVYGLATAVFGVSTSFGLSLGALAITGAADMVSIVVRQSLVQLETPDAMRGRVSAVNSVFIGASNQLGEFESGATAALLGPVGSVLLGGIGSIALAIAWWRLFPALAQRDHLVRPG